MSNTKHSESKEKRYTKAARKDRRNNLYNYMSRTEPSEKAKENFHRPLYGGMTEKYNKALERRKEGKDREGE